MQLLSIKFCGYNQIHTWKQRDEHNCLGDRPQHFTKSKDFKILPLPSSFSFNLFLRNV